MKITRRHVIVGLAAVTAAGAGGVGAHVASWWAQDPTAPYLHLSAEEVAIFDALAEAAWPTGGDPAIGGRDAGASRYLDGVLVGMPETQRDLLRLSLHAVDALPLATHGARFRSLPDADAQALLAAWLSSDTAELRTLVQSFQLLSGMAWTTHPQVAPRLVAWFGCGFGRAEAP